MKNIESSMCNLYSLNKNRESVAKMFNVGHNRAVDIPLLPCIFPNYNAPVMRASVDGERELINMNWGFVLPQPGKAPRRVTDVRDDKAMTGFWRESLEHRRCLVPASAFCEPDGEVKPATWNWFASRAMIRDHCLHSPACGADIADPSRRMGLSLRSTSTRS